MAQTEGATVLPFDAVASSAAGPGPGVASRETPFYNPAMALNRDLTVLTVAAEAARRGRGIDVADALCGAGARALRIANEVAAPLVVHANDARPDALEALAPGAAANGVEDRIDARRGDAYAFLASRRFDVVDIDPYGSPAPFVDAALRATRHDGVLLLTATDTAALCGVYPRVARRRYGLVHDLHKWPWRTEVGLRGLLSLAVRAAGRAERGVTPLWSVSQGHWMRVAVRVHDGATAADRAWRQLAWAMADGRGAAEWTPMPSGPTAGPLWAGPMHDRAYVQTLATRDERGMSARRTALDDLLLVLADEADAPAFWVDLDAFCGQRRCATMPTAKALEVLRAAGHQACRTHMSSKGVRTDAPIDELARLLAA